MSHRSSHFAILTTVAIAALALGACSKPGEPSAGQRVDKAIATVEREAAKLGAEANHAAAQAKRAATEAVQDAKQTAETAAAQVSTASADAAIVISVNLGLARDGKLDPAKIDVEATRGRVTLRGTAPDAESVMRARQIVLAIKGVTGVDNYLTVNPKA